jgi:hypothetical protein
VIFEVLKGLVSKLGVDFGRYFGEKWGEVGGVWGEYGKKRGKK